MKNKIYILLLSFPLLLTTSCSRDENPEVKPSDISSISTFEEPGKIGITWKYEEPKNIEYIKFSYFDKKSKKDVVRLASSYSDTLIIPNTLKRLGEYEFTIQPFSYTHTAGNKHSLKAVSGPAPKVTTIESTNPIILSEKGLYTDAQEQSEGPIANLIDGSNDTYFHSNWHNPGAMPHYIVVNLGKKVKGFNFTYVTRNTGDARAHPKKMNIYVSNTFDGNNYDVSSIKKVVEIEAGLPNGASQTYTSGNYIVDDGDGYQYIWFQVRETHGGSNFFALSQLKISELTLKVNDPESVPNDN